MYRFRTQVLLKTIFFVDGSSNSSVDEIRTKENQALWEKILLLIVTDFICWVPICIISIISFAGGSIPGLVYQITAVILFPINSAANPWLYSSFLSNYVKKISRRTFSRRTTTSSECRRSYVRRNNAMKCWALFRKRRESLSYSLDRMPTSPSSTEHNSANYNLTMATDL